MSIDPLQARQRRYFDDLYGFFTGVVETSTNDLTLVDFGSGRNGYVNLYKEHFGKCVAVDIVDHAEHYRDGVEFVLAGPRHIPLPDESVDVVVSHSALEHVEDVDTAISEINRILRVGGLGYLTVAGLYFSPSGGHLRIPGRGFERLDDWEHLDPDSPHYLDTPVAQAWTPRGARLNKLTTSQFLASVGRQPWDILSYKVSPQRKKRLPSHLRGPVVNRYDFFVRALALIGRKSFDVVDDEVAMS